MLCRICASARLLCVTNRVIGSGRQSALGVLPRRAACGGPQLFPVFSTPPVGPLSHCGRVDGRRAAENAVICRLCISVGLHSTDATGVEAADSADRTREAIQVGLHAIEHPAGIALLVMPSLSWLGVIGPSQVCLFGHQGAVGNLALWVTKGFSGAS